MASAEATVLGKRDRDGTDTVGIKDANGESQPRADQVAEDDDDDDDDIGPMPITADGASDITRKKRKGDCYIFLLINSLLLTSYYASSST